MTTIILHQRVFINSNSSSKVNNNKVARYVNNRGLYSLIRHTMFRIIPDLLELHARGSAEYYQSRYIPCFVYCWIPQYYSHPGDKPFLNDSLDHGEFLRCFGCSLHMDFWVGISNRFYWWSFTLRMIHMGGPFLMNKYMSWHSFDGNNYSCRYTNTEVQYEDVSLHMKKME